MKKEDSSINVPTFSDHRDNFYENSKNDSSFELEINPDTHDQDYHSNENVQNQLVVYDCTANGTGLINDSEPLVHRSSLRISGSPGQTSRAFPEVSSFAVQCAICFKWRIVPTKEKYEEIRERVLEQPFVCEEAHEWHCEVSCDDPPDIEQDDTRLWAIDKPSISQPPLGWQRLLKIRGEGGTKFADVYYVAPTGKKFRSMVEIQKFLEEHPEYILQGVRMSQFSFQIPKPLNQNYVRKRPARSYEPSEVLPIAWAGPCGNTDLQLGEPGPSNLYLSSPVSELENQPLKKQKRKTP